MILSIDTSTEVGSLALSSNGKLLTSVELHIKNSHSEFINNAARSLVRYAGIEFNDLEAVGISKGPGSYTGLRIGVAFAKGLAFALNIPLLAINSLHLLAMGLRNNVDHEGFICPMIDARRMEVYTALYNKDLFEILPVHARIIDQHSFQDELNRSKIQFIGNGSDKCRELIKHPNANFSGKWYPNIKEAVKYFQQAFDNQQFEDVTYFEPFYLKEFTTKPSKNRL